MRLVIHGIHRLVNMPTVKDNKQANQVAQQVMRICDNRCIVDYYDEETFQDEADDAMAINIIKLAQYEKLYRLIYKINNYFNGDIIRIRISGPDLWFIGRTD